MKYKNKDIYLVFNVDCYSDDNGFQNDRVTRGYLVTKINARLYKQFLIKFKTTKKLIIIDGSSSEKIPYSEICFYDCQKKEFTTLINIPRSDSKEKFIHSYLYDDIIIPLTDLEPEIELSYMGNYAYIFSEKKNFSCSISSIKEEVLDVENIEAVKLYIELK
jgi:hypothetical protein